VSKRQLFCSAGCKYTNFPSVLNHRYAYEESLIGKMVRIFWKKENDVRTPPPPHLRVFHACAVMCLFAKQTF
jgi:hypothetical protein